MPDPKVPNIITELPGPRSKELIAVDERFVSQSYTRAYPTVIAKTQGTIIWDVDGNVFLDFHAGVACCSTGSCHPKVVEAIKTQAEKAIHIASADFYNEPVGKLAQKLAEITPGDQNKRTFFTNSGTEAVEAGFKLARYNKRRPKTVAFMGAFHGRTMGALSLTNSKEVQRRYFAPFVPEVVHVPYAYCYRCDFHLSYPNCDMACVHFIEDRVFKTVAQPEDIALLIVEPIQGEGGYIIPPKEFHPMLKALCEKYDIVYMVDEVQSGMGRTGRWWAIEHWGVVPDIIASAKGIASGMPLGACIASQELMHWEPGAHSTTFGGNPIACAAALATIDVIADGLMENATGIGKLMIERLQTLKENYAIIGDVRGLGLMIGIEFVKDKISKTPAPEKATRVQQECFHNGLMVLTVGNNCIRFCPPLTITEEEADIGLRIFEKAVSKAAKEAA